MKKKTRLRGKSSEKIVKDIRRATRRRRSPEEKIRIVLDGLRGVGKHRRTVSPGRSGLPGTPRVLPQQMK